MQHTTLMLRSGAKIALAMALLGTVTCTDLDVENLTEPDRERALANAGDLEQLIAGAFNSWWQSQSQSSGMGNSLSGVAMQHSQWAGNFAFGFLHAIPRPVLPNETSSGTYGNLAHNWLWNYRAASSAQLAILAIEAGADLGADEARARAFAKFIQGLAHGTVALLYDRGFILDETVEDVTSLELQPYTEVMDAALGYLDEAIAIAQQNTFTIPALWMSRATTSQELVGIAYAYKARFRIQVARDPEQREAVDWNAVLADLDRAMTGDFVVEIGGAFGHQVLYNGARCRWSQQQNWLRGMADQSGAYQEWIATPLMERTPFLWITPDKRFPQGNTIDEQRANPGRYIIIPGSRGMTCSLGDHFNSPAQGTWRWSNYRDDRHDAWILRGQTGPAVELSQRELRLHRAEAYLRMNRLADAAAIIDETRVKNGGLGPAMANADCVPRLPNGSCGNLMETLKWEHRLETYQMGYGKAFFEARGWGDLIEGTFLQVPVPEGELLFLGEPAYTFGGTAPSSAGRGTYGFP
jgi:hypothetical protein